MAGMLTDVGANLGATVCPLLGTQRESERQCRGTAGMAYRKSGLGSSRGPSGAA
jgi:hypothetical protein